MAVAKIMAERLKAKSVMAIESNGEENEIINNEEEMWQRNQSENNV
jgi:hypothetical protein